MRRWRSAALSTWNLRPLKKAVIVTVAMFAESWFSSPRRSAVGLVQLAAHTPAVSGVPLQCAALAVLHGQVAAGDFDVFAEGGPDVSEFAIDLVLDLGSLLGVLEFDAELEAVPAGNAQTELAADVVHLQRA